MAMMEAKTSAFVETFGDSPYVRALDFFLMFPSFDYSKTQVAREAGVSRITMDSIWSQLLKEGFIKKTRDIGRAELFKLNVENPRIKALMDTDFRLSQAFAQEQLAAEKIPAKNKRAQG
ncbi:MAG: hypothetical protein V1708_04035 [Candidatus Micrarchaeota archaeon]